MREFEPATENAALKDAIVAAIQRDGAISFRDFMSMALYRPGLGYYCSPREKMGREGDYLTSPEVSPLFGAMVGRKLRGMWEAMERPNPFQVVEAGAGSGRLCRDILRWADRAAPELSGALQYAIVEASPALERRQRSLLDEEGLSVRIRWHESLPAGIEGCILSNELLDAMPVHRVSVRDGVLKAVFVRWEGARLEEELREAPPEIGEYFQRLGLLPGEGCYAEVNLEALRWMRDAGRALRRGFVLTFDYGYEAEDMFARWRTDGTLLCFYRHNPSTDPYARIGRQDITSHVDFTSVRRAGEDAGLKTIENLPQADFLIKMGIAEALSPAESITGLEEYYARRRAVMDLADPAGLGRIRVLVQAKGLGGAGLRVEEGDE